MKKYLIILFLAIFTFSCGDDSQLPDGSFENQPPAKTEQVQDADQKENKKEDKENNSEKNGSASLILNFVVIVSLLLSVAAFIMALTQMMRKKTPPEEELENVKKDLARALAATRSLDDSIKLLKYQNSSTSHPSERNNPNRIGGGRHVNKESNSQKPEEVKKDTQKDAPKEDSKNNDQILDSNKQTTPRGRASKLIYLGINSQNFFTDISEEKTETSKFVASLITAEVATFEVIDVERIRSVNTAYSVKQKGSVAIKDANGIKHQEPGKMHKSIQGDQAYWVIDSPVIVEFTK